jgi:O-acetyl-ADP-ribose deacetylase (regulator of RNase III)
MLIEIFDVNALFITELRESKIECRTAHKITANLATVQEVSAPALVSPANSFGFMDGGIDAVYEHMYPGTQERLQNRIRNDFNGELPVGCAAVVSTYGSPHTWIIAAPTMRTPQRIPPINAYMATRAALLAAETMLPTVHHVALPGMGTGAGGLSPKVGARAMMLALRDLHRPFPSSWREAGRIELELNGDSD